MPSSDSSTSPLPFPAQRAYGEAERVDFSTRTVHHPQCHYTTCQRKPGPSWMPDWILRASSLAIDQEQEIGDASGALLSFKGVPLLPIPSLTFPLGDKRKSVCCRPRSAGQQERPGSHAALLLEHRAQPRCHAVPDADVTARRRHGREFRTWSRLQRRDARQLPANDRLRDGLNRWGFAAQHSQPMLRCRCWQLEPVPQPQRSATTITGATSRAVRIAHAAPVEQRGHAELELVDVSVRPLSSAGRPCRTPEPIVPPMTARPSDGAATRYNTWGGFDTNVKCDYTTSRTPSRDPCAGVPTTPK
jgi:hypothetical protein